MHRQTPTKKPMTPRRDVSSSSVQTYLPKLVMAKYDEIESYTDFKEVRDTTARLLYKRGTKLPDADIARIQRLRKTHTIFETVSITGFSPSVVQRYSRKKDQ